MARDRPAPPWPRFIRFAGYRVGCYSSPHLLEYNERIRVDNVPVDDAALCAAFARVEAARQQAGEMGGEIALTYFEFGYAWRRGKSSRRAAVDVLILEVGLGGRLDAVNIYDADCAVVTGVALDHTDWLGATREAIGFEKAGIYRAADNGQHVAICADPEPPQSLLDHAAAIGADLRVLGRDFGAFCDLGDKTQWTFWQSDGRRRAGLPYPALPGSFQLRNAAAVLCVVEALGDRLPVAPAALCRGLQEVHLAGRFEVLPGRPAIVLDVAHNPQAVAGLADNLAAMGRFARTIAVVGMLADKDIAGALGALAGKIDVWLLASLDVPRGAPAEALAAVVAEQQLGGDVEAFVSPAEAFARAAKQAGEDDRIAVFGSFHTVAAVLRVLKHPG